MEEEKLTKPLLSYEEVIEVMDKHISRGEPAVCDKRIVRVEKVAEQMDEDRKKGRSYCRKVFLFYRRFMKKSLIAFMCIASFLIMTACGGPPVDKALKKVDASIEKLEKIQKKGGKLNKEELDALGKELEEPIETLKKAVENDEVGGLTKIKIVTKLGKWAVLAVIGIINAVNGRGKELPLIGKYRILK